MGTGQKSCHKPMSFIHGEISGIQKLILLTKFLDVFSQATEEERQSIKIVEKAAIHRCINRNDEVEVCSGSVHHGSKQSYPPSQGMSEHWLLFIK